jgi:hypothetical protein
MPEKFRTRERYGEAFWRKHHEAWQQSALNQREYCEAHGIPLKASAIEQFAMDTRRTQSRFSMLICRISPRSSASICGRPPRLCD